MAISHGDSSLTLIFQGFFQKKNPHVTWPLLAPISTRTTTQLLRRFGAVRAHTNMFSTTRALEQEVSWKPKMSRDRIWAAFALSEVCRPWYSPLTPIYKEVELEPFQQSLGFGGEVAWGSRFIPSLCSLNSCLYDAPRRVSVNSKVEGLSFVDDLGQGLLCSMLGSEPSPGSRLVGVRGSHHSRVITAHHLLHYKLQGTSLASEPWQIIAPTRIEENMSQHGWRRCTTPRISHHCSRTRPSVHIGTQGRVGPVRPTAPPQLWWPKEAIWVQLILWVSR